MGPAAVVTSTQEERLSLVLSFQDGAIHIPKVGRNALQGPVLSAVAAITIFKERYTAQLNGYDWSMVQ